MTIKIYTGFKFSPTILSPVQFTVDCIVSFPSQYTLIMSNCVGWEGWSGGSMVLGNLPVPGRPLIWIRVGQGPTALAVSAGGGCLDIFTLVYQSRGRKIDPPLLRSFG